MHGPPPTPAEPPSRAWAAELPGLLELGRSVRARVLADLAAARARGDLAALARQVALGAGDVTFALDEPAEQLVQAWAERRARSGPLSVLTEDAGWRHLGPGPSGGVAERPDFDHGGPRIAFDPIDGTRNLLGDLRSGWFVVSFAGPGRGEPRFDDVAGGLLVELPPAERSVSRTLEAARGRGCRLASIDLVHGQESAARELRADTDDRADHGYFPFFRYAPDMRPAIARVEAAFFAASESELGADVRNCWDDQSCASADQLVHLATGRYRMLADLRPLVARAAGRPTQPSKPYDVAGAMRCALEAGCVLTDLDGRPLDFPIDCTTPVGWIGFANAATAARLAPILQAVLSTELQHGRLAADQT